MPSSHASKSRDNTTDDLKEQAGEVAEDLRELGRLARAVLAERADELKQGAVEKAEAARDSVQHAGDQLSDRVREQPLRGLAIAAAVGALFGVLWSRR